MAKGQKESNACERPKDNQENYSGIFLTVVLKKNIRWLIKI